MAMVPSRYVNLASARARFGARVDRLAPYLLQSDVPADAAVTAVRPWPRRERMALIDRALDGERFADEPRLRPLVDLVDGVRELPVWFDERRAALGARAFVRSGMVGGIVLGAKALVYGYAAPGGNKPLVLSGRLEGPAAARRLDETARFVQAVTAPGGMVPGRDGWRITIRVRLMHAEVRHMIVSSPKVEWDNDVWGLPINQHDMAATTLLFSLVTLDGIRQFGLTPSSDEIDGYYHLWRWVGTVIGVVPELLSDTELAARTLAELIEATQLGPDDDSRTLVQALLDSGHSAPTEERRQRARRMRPLSEGLCRALIGDELADKLGVPSTRWAHALDVVRVALRGLEAARTRSAALDERLVRVGTEYWLTVLREGMLNATETFNLPDELKGLAGFRGVRQAMRSHGARS